MAAFADDYMILPLSDGGQVLVAWVDNSTTAVLAWRAADNATESITSSSVQMAATSFLGGDFSNARVNNATLDPFQRALQGSNSSQNLAMVCCTHSALMPLDCESGRSDRSCHQLNCFCQPVLHLVFVCYSGPGLFLLVRCHAAQQCTALSVMTRCMLPWTACLTHSSSPPIVKAHKFLLLQNLISM